jgi:SAM-dependent methyltransferase
VLTVSGPPDHIAGMHNFDAWQTYYSGYLASPVDTTLSPRETMGNQWYFEVGRSAVEVVMAAGAASMLRDVRRVLDLPCGHGRVLRHLVKLFPQASFDACDLDRDGVEFCAATFGARPIVSVADLTAVDFGAAYDLIWVGSLFTHTSAEKTQAWLAHLATFLTPHGMIVATVHGRWCEEVQKHSPYIAAERWQRILDGYAKTGYGYVDYATEESHDYIPGSYGVSLARPHVIMRMVEQIPGVRILLYAERAWADHQDVIAFGRPAFDKPWG